MNQHLQTILNFIQQSEHLSDEEKTALLKAAKTADKELEITAFKLERTEKVKHTTAILLEETIEELEQKRKAVERQNRELEIETALEKVRTIAMGMKEPADMLDVCKTISHQLQSLGVKEIRNVQTAIFYETKGTYMNYEYYAKHNKTFITETIYTNHEVAKAFAAKMLKGKGEIFITYINGEKEVKEWLAYQKTTNVFIDTFLETASSLNYYWFSLGPVALGISTYVTLSDDELGFFERFLNVFELAYRRYLDIEKAIAQAKEAQIELALERVRARTMAMQKSDELAETVFILFQQFKELGENPDQATIGIINEDEWVIEYWVTMYGNQTDRVFKFSINEPNVTNKIYKAWKEQKKSLVIDLSGKELYDFATYRAGMGGAAYNEAENRRVINVAFFSKGLINVQSNESRSAESVLLLERFAAVFEQTYTRFLDLQKAEAQARESQIQLALERVRARTMAMQHSDELKEAAALLFQQAKALGVPAYSCGYNIWEKDEKEFTSWMSTQDGSIINGIPNIPLTEDANFIRYVESKQNGEAFFVLELRGERMQEHYQYLKTIPAFKGYFDYAVSVGFDLPKTQIHYLANFSHGNLLFISLEPCPEFHDVFKRFAAVFEQTYTRFLDLQKAEAQARESQIQLALERVRARTMAMQHSDELKDAAALLFQQAKALGVPAYSCGYNIWEKDEKEFTSWMSTQDGSIINGIPNIPLTEDANFIRYVESKQNGEAFFVLELRGERMQEHYQYLKTIPAFKGYFDYAVSVGFDLPKTQIHYLANFSHGNLLFISLEPCPEFHDVFKRFAAVFEQTYTRFLDLQKAEAQAREGQIQLAMERVRARTMAMQNSNELPEAANLLFQQVKSLGMPAWTAGYCIWDEDKKAVTAWMGLGDVLNPSYKMSLTEEPTFIHMKEAYDRGETFFVDEIKGEQLVNHYQYMFGHPVVGEMLKKHNEAGHPLPTYQINHCAYFSQGFLIFITYEPVPDAHDIFKRFAKVFEQTYTRFLDLQKAEAQARESQIQLALERVRARTMAMQKSDELADAASLLFKQLDDQGIKSWSSGFNIWQDDGRSATINMCNPDGTIATPYHLPHTEDVFFIKICEARQRGDDLLVMETGGKELEETYNYMFSLPEVKKVLGGMEDTGFQIPKFQVNHCVFFSQGYLMFITYEPVPEMWDIFKRFGKVFEQTYTRFLDLQKAEAQAREAQIELGLERVRARAMAMQKSDELKELIGTVYNELTKLDLSLDRCLIWVMNSEDFSSRLWMANAESQPVNFYIPHHDNPPYLAFVKAWKDRNRRWFYDLHGQVKKEWDGYVFNQTEMKHLPDLVKKKMQATDRVMLAGSFHNFGCLQTAGTEPLKEEQFDILNRFAKVFDLTYTRFNDLKQAEAQTREAQIELGLERVRARAMAMQKSNELSQLVDTVFKELTKLDFALNWCIINIIDESSLSNLVWAANPDIDKVPDSYHMKFEDYPFHDAMMKGYKERATKYIYVLEGLEKKVYDEYLFKETEFRKVPEVAQAASRAMEKYVVSFSFSNFGGLQTVGNEPLSGANLDILARFGKVFDLTYTRFNDLQKAEAQAREAEIELALERVRARTMAMQKSQELKEVIQLVYEQFVHLNIYIEHTGFLMDYKARDDLHIWLADRHLVPSEVTIPWFDSPPNNSIKEAKEKGQDFFKYHLTFEEKNKFYRDLFEFIPGVQEETLKYYLNCPGLAGSGVLLENIGLYIENFSGTPYTDEENNTLMRFGKVFQQTYTRFLDLQKAEAQVRESQIQLALERARTQSMIMQHSNELDDTLRVFHEQVLLLDIPSAFSFLWLPDEDKDRHIFWAAWAENNATVFNSKAINYPLDRNEPATAQCLIDWKSSEPVVSYHVPPNGVKNYFGAWSELIAGVEQLKPEYFSDGLYYVEAFMKYGCFGVMVKSELNENEKKILHRFTVEFQQTYTRFLDLQKAEAQAREAQIEAALERVRSRTMGMQHSNELQETALLLFQQVLALDVSQLGCGFNIWDDDRKAFTSWMGGGLGENTVLPTFKVPTSEDIFLHIREAAESGELLFVRGQSGEELEEHYRYMFSLPIWKDIMKGWTPPTYQVLHCAFFAQGFLMFVSTEPVPQAHDIFKRFAKVFEQTYTRFLDLQKAEAQAREAQIEAALERVRSRSIAMRKSEEIADIAGKIFSELRQLDLTLNRVLIWTFNDIEKYTTWWSSNPEVESTAESYRIDYNENPAFINYLQAWQQRKPIHLYFLAGDIKESWSDFLFEHTELSRLPAAVRKNMREEGDLFTISVISDYGLMMTGSLKPLSDANIDIIQRFGRVFQQSYTRYLDVQKAEAQAREAQIEAALEKIRSRSLGMHQSDELKDVITVVLQKLQELNIAMASRVAVIVVFDGNYRDFNQWVASPDFSNMYISTPYFEHRVLDDFWKAKEGRVDFYSNAYTVEEKNSYFNYFFEHSIYENLAGLDDQKKWVLDQEYYAYSPAFEKNSSLGIADFSGIPLSESEIAIIKRFAKVFEQAYIRFLDLQKAEAQAREAQIEAALERVRSRSMAMFKSEELSDVITVVADQLQQLNVRFDHVSFVINSDAEDYHFWTALYGKPHPYELKVPYLDNPIANQAKKARSQGIKFFQDTLTPEENRQWLEHAFGNNPVDFFTPGEKAYAMSRGFSRSIALMPNIMLAVGNYASKPYSDDDNGIIKRFASVFEQSYTRFLDLKKSEAQAREAQIEAALERVRSKTMAMHNSNDVGATVLSMFDELISIGVDKKTRCGIGILGDADNMELWTASTDPTGKAILHIGNLDMTLHPLLKGVKNAWRNKEKSYTYELTGEDLVNYFTAINNAPDYNATVDLRSLPEKVIHNDFTFSDGTLFVFTENPIPDELANIFKRFAGVFGQTYRRYMDLLKAEAQAREATIETALEKVRGKAMAMHNSNDLSVTASMVFTELRKLGITPIRCGVGLLNRESRKAQLYAATSSNDGDSLSLVGLVELSGHPVLEKIYDTWLKNEDYYPELIGEQLTSYYKFLLKGLPVPVPDSQDIQKQYGTFLYFSVGGLFTWSENPYNEAEIKILKRFATIIDLTFRRYIELQKSEANAREAVKRAALDRVRAEIASMRTINDLDRITPLIWNELTILGVPFIRCGVFIMDESQQLIHTFLSTPDGKAIAAFHLPYTTPGNIADVLSHWRDKKNYIDHWDESAFTEFANILVKQGELASAEQYLKTIPHGGFHLHFLPFLQGMLYVGNTTQLGKEEIDVIQSIAEAFSTAYARYEDFNKLEAAKKQVDSTLNDLQATQKQLIQSEKMASLGELTAGIAHEIQNPLNFVNNFSEVNKELLAEMTEEIEKGNFEEAKSLAKDVTDNEEKINHHGKRADAIVKGMLQHSRSSAGVKEPTDINALADEYLRLTYHGLRAKDKTFNATVKTDFEAGVKKVYIIPQDIGRVILNLITNAFYAVTEKKKQVGDGYEPTVTVSTKQNDRIVEIRVADNGNGIPQKVLDKIFQPFFTTKPTGQGTGLGLSLSYDIVKAHGGQIKVETREGEGTELIIQLPLI